MNKEEYITSRVESKLIGKIANHRLMTRETFRNRHKGAFLDVNKSQCMHHINELRVWLRIAQLVDEAKYKMPSCPFEPYETYYAKQLTKNK
jgi:hypothetical protein